MLLTGLIAYWLIYPDLVNGQLLLIQARAIDSSAVSFLISSPVRTAIEETFILFFTPVLLPLILIGIVRIFRDRLFYIIGIVSVAATLTFMQVLALDGREPYFLFLPLTLLSALGLRDLFFNLKANVRSHVRALGKALVLGFLVYSLLAVTYIASNPKFGLDTYVSREEVAFADLLISIDLRNNRFITLNDPGIVRIGVLSDNHVVVGDSRYFDLTEYRQVYFLIFETDCEVILDETTVLGVNGLFLRTEWAFGEQILETYRGCFASASAIEAFGLMLVYWGL